MQTSFYEPAAERIAASIHPSLAGIDSLAFDRRDYKAKLLYLSVEAARKYRAKHDTPENEARYVYGSLWKRSRSWARARDRRERLDHLPMPSAPASTAKAEVESFYEARSILATLRERLDPETWNTLLRIGEAGGIAQAHNPASDGEYSGFRKRVREYRARARRVLER